MTHPGQRALWNASLNIAYLYWMVIYKERHVTELVKFIQVRYTINSDGLLLSRENYLLLMVRNFLLIIRREDLLKALAWFWIIDETLVLTSILSVCRLNEVGTCQVMEQVMIMVMMVMTTR